MVALRVAVGLGILVLLAGLWLHLGAWRVTRRLEPAAIRHVVGRCFAASLGEGGLFQAAGDSDAWRNRSRARLYEDGRALGPARSPVVAIEKNGRGAYTHWRTSIYFSTSDNSDPRSNARAYVVHVPLLFPNWVLISAAALVAAAAAAIRALTSERPWRHRIAAAARWKAGAGPRLGSGSLLAGAAAGGLAAVLSLFAVPAAPIWGYSTQTVLFAVTFGAVVVHVVLSRGGRESLGTRRAAALVVALATVWFIAPLGVVWARAETGGSLIGGVIPYSDALNYYTGGLRLLYDGTLDGWNMRRPQNAAFQALRLVLVGYDLRRSLALAAFVLGVLATVAAWQLAAVLGRPAGCLFFVLISAFSVPYLPTTLTEPHGIALGLMSLTVFLHCVRQGWTPPRFGLAVALLGASLNARSGPFLVVPLILLWGVAAIATRARWRYAAWGLAGCALAWVWPVVLNTLWGTDEMAIHANFGHTLYGMAVGGKGWGEVYKDHPGVAETKFLALAWERIKADPWPFARHYVREVARFPSFCDTLVPPFLALAFTVRCLLIAGFLWTCGRARTHFGFLTGTLVGIVASAPFLMQDGGPRVFASVVPFLFALVAAGTYPMIQLLDLAPRRRHSPEPLPIIACNAVALAALVVLPIMVVVVHPRRSMTGQCGQGLVPLGLTVGRTGTAIDVDRHALGADRRRTVSFADFVRDPDFGDIELAPAFKGLEPPFTIMAIYDLGWRATASPYIKYAILPGRSDSLRGRLIACAAPTDDPALSAWRSYLYTIKYVRGAP